MTRRAGVDLNRDFPDPIHHKVRGRAVLSGVADQQRVVRAQWLILKGTALGHWCGALNVAARQMMAWVMHVEPCIET